MEQEFLKEVRELGKISRAAASERNRRAKEDLRKTDEDLEEFVRRYENKD
ncbi:hypothetical protein GP475_09615 [Corynebacterium poyangense]|uniref:Uncharacterized protein n=1 Tax=Corynebacterium poyangense TaxID=2684405 RepID=A0A7H0SQP2_9CORY|nr:hypothetical protein [Corynebacterium poyangense]QNQ90867.1 hypothetical protein GP475_09615 [Corynebacterium poyangense]